MIIKQLTKTRFEVSCDECQKISQRCKSQLGNELHFCSRECVRLAKLCGGKIAEKIAKTNLEKYGCVNVFASQNIKEKIKFTLLEKYGVDNPQKSKMIRDKVKITCIKKYGVDNPSKSQVVKDKESLTHKSKSKEDKQSSLEKRINTNIKKYGVAFPMQIQTVKLKFNWAEVYLKSIETKKKNKTGSWSSKVELTIRDVLFEIFGKENVVEQQKVNKHWTVDFYIKSHDVFLQVDGVYWHGLDRPIDVIKEFKSSKDKSILSTFLKDRKQDEWARTNNIKLIRITDQEIKQWQKNQSLNQIIEKKIVQ